MLANKAYIMVIYYSAGLAQLVEQLICNQQVEGSSPLASSIFTEGFPSWPKGADCKSVVSDFDGSNPSLSTRNRNSIKRIAVFLSLMQ